MILVNELYFLFAEILIKKKLMVSLVIRWLLMRLANTAKRQVVSTYGIVGYISCHNHVTANAFVGMRTAINDM